MDKKRWIIFGVICLAIFGILIFNKKSDDVDVKNIDASKIITKKDDKIGDHVFGSPDKKVVLIEYGDYQCPGCGSLYPSVESIKNQYKDQLTFVFRNFPLTSLHPNALAASSAAEAAGLQDAFWKYYSLLYENQDDWSTLDVSKRGVKFETYAKTLGLDAAKFTKDVTGKTVALKIQQDQALGKKINVTSTPTLILNGKVLQQDKWSSAEALENVIREAIKESGQTLPEKISKNE